ncbi:MAG TPA: hypothetical protein VH541_02155 [Gaiellaceae bacterium]
MDPVGERSRAGYRIVCVVRRADGHVRAVGYSTNESGADHDALLTLEEARRAIQQGLRLYAVSPSTGVEVELELHGEGIRAGPGESADLDLDDLPTCG